MGQGVGEGKQEGPIRRPQGGADMLLGDGFAAAHAHIQDGQGVAHPALGGAGNQVQGLRLGLFAALRDNVFQMPGDLILGIAAEVVPLAAGQDGGGQLLGLGGGQDEHHVFRRLLQRFQQRVERGVGEHVHFVDDVHLVLAELRGIIHLFQQLANFLHAAVAGGVHFVHVKGRAAFDHLAGGAFPAGVAVLGVQAVDGPGQDAGGAGFAGAAAAAEQVSVGDAARHHLIAQRAHDGLLAHHIGKGLGPPDAVQGLVQRCVLPFR